MEKKEYAVRAGGIKKNKKTRPEVGDGRELTTDELAEEPVCTK